MYCASCLLVSKFGFEEYSKPFSQVAIPCLLKSWKISHSKMNRRLAILI
jgi:hypothetical protein